MHNHSLAYLTDVQRAYLAGIIDGEACISLSMNRSKTQRSPVVRVSLGNTSPALLRWWLQTLPDFGNLYFRSSKSNKHKNHWVWEVSSRKAEVLLKEVCSFLTIKQEIAQLALSVLSEAVGKAAKLTDVKRQFFIQAVDKATTLNKKGTNSAELESIDHFHELVGAA